MMVPRRLRALSAWLLLAQTGLVGVLGSGLHDLFDCCHGPAVASACSCDCGTCPYSEREREADPGWGASDEFSPATADCSGYCAVCDVLGQYQTAATVASPVVGFTAPRCQAFVEPDAVWTASAVRLAPSRGPPVA